MSNLRKEFSRDAGAATRALYLDSSSVECPSLLQHQSVLIPRRDGGVAN
jgi:hypothetical protein